MNLPPSALECHFLTRATATLHQPPQKSNLSRDSGRFRIVYRVCKSNPPESDRTESSIRQQSLPVEILSIKFMTCCASCEIRDFHMFIHEPGFFGNPGIPCQLEVRCRTLNEAAQLPMFWFTNPVLAVYLDTRKFILTASTGCTGGRGLLLLFLNFV